MKLLSMRHSILIKRRSRLNGQSAIPLLKEIPDRNSGFASGLRSRFRKQENTPHEALKLIYFQHTIQTPTPFHPSGAVMEGKTDLLHQLPPCVLRSSHGCSTLPSMTQNLPSWDQPSGHAAFPPRHPRWKKKIPPSFIPSKTPPFHGTGKSGAFVVETDN